MRAEMASTRQVAGKQKQPNNDTMSSPRATSKIGSPSSPASPATINSSFIGPETSYMTAASIGSGDTKQNMRLSATIGATTLKQSDIQNALQIKGVSNQLQ